MLFFFKAWEVNWILLDINVEGLNSYPKLNPIKYNTRAALNSIARVLFCLWRKAGLQMRCDAAIFSFGVLEAKDDHRPTNSPRHSNFLAIWRKHRPDYKISLCHTFTKCPLLFSTHQKPYLRGLVVLFVIIFKVSGHPAISWNFIKYKWTLKRKS